MKTIALKLTTNEAIRAACELSNTLGTEYAQVVYKSELFEDDDYVEADLEEFAEVNNDPMEFDEFCGGGRHSWELWIYDRAVLQQQVEVPLLDENAFNAAFMENLQYKPDIDHHWLYCFVSYYESAKGGV